MGSVIEINDTLKISKNQGFPIQLDFEKHKANPLDIRMFDNVIFDFYNKKDIRIYHIPPVRNFLVESIDDKWLYWGLIDIIQVNHDYLQKMTSGKFQLKYIYSLDEMESAHKLIDRNRLTNYFR